MARRVDPVQERLRRAALEQAAYQAIFDYGFANVTLADIALRAGVSKGTLVYHFGSKEELLAAVMRRFVRTVSAATRRALRLAPTPEAKLRAYVDNQFYGIVNTRRFYTVSLDLLSAAARDEALMAVQRQFVAANLSLDAELARLGTPGGPAETEARAWQLRALVDGLSMRFLSDAEPDLQHYRRVCLMGLRAVLWPRSDGVQEGQSAPDRVLG
ncbi:TetR family transcriptional regulator [Deinococcus irradiatisoli]|uniref:TetR family transcriptional regulator n=1 Tax=Deinococcus irradiatisoli TaxID=2202254 RepID=A0A2Z3JHR4_9DEIO|nr:TetR family transcriptional regulator [Deinococcus irradiatisoli]AWN22930.1 TetR family transcriptional regulator [Deinococcus irradiatisoli]